MTRDDQRRCEALRNELLAWMMDREVPPDPGLLALVLCDMLSLVLEHMVRQTPSALIHLLQQLQNNYRIIQRNLMRAAGQIQSSDDPPDPVLH
jgi:hypothetical protein